MIGDDDIFLSFLCFYFYELLVPVEDMDYAKYYPHKDLEKNDKRIGEVKFFNAYFIGYSIDKCMIEKSYCKNKYIKSKTEIKEYIQKND